MTKIIRLGIRPSRLALKQAEELCGKIPDVEFDIIKIETKGDKDKKTPLSQVERTDFFTWEIEEALLEGRIDAAIHSAKDLEEKAPDGLEIACITDSLSPFECLVSNDNLKLNELPLGAIVGTSSSKRKEAIKRYRSDIITRDIRGDIDERLKKLYEKKYDAIIVAHAALLRLGYQDKIAEIIDVNIIKPHPLQGKLAVQVRSGDDKITQIFKG